MKKPTKKAPLPKGTGASPRPDLLDFEALKADIERLKRENETLKSELRKKVSRETLARSKTAKRSGDNPVPSGKVRRPLLSDRSKNPKSEEKRPSEPAYDKQQKKVSSSRTKRGSKDEGGNRGNDFPLATKLPPHSRAHSKPAPTKKHQKIPTSSEKPKSTKRLKSPSAAVALSMRRFLRAAVGDKDAPIVVTNRDGSVDGQITIGEHPKDTFGADGIDLSLVPEGVFISIGIVSSNLKDPSRITVPIPEQGSRDQYLETRLTKQVFTYYMSARPMRGSRKRLIGGHTKAQVTAENIAATLEDVHGQEIVGTVLRLYWSPDGKPPERGGE